MDSEDYKARYEAILKEYNRLKLNEDELAKLGMKFEMVDPKKLKPYKNNNKRHGQKDLAALNASVDAAGFKNVLRVEKDYTIIAGHGSDIVAINRDLPLIPVVVCFDLSKTQAQVLRIADNVTSRLSKFNDDAMTVELAEIKQDTDFNFSSLAPLKLDKWDVPLELPEFDLDGFEEKKPEDMTVEDVAPIHYASDNDDDIPTLVLKLQATALVNPVVQWGDIARATKFYGTWHYYCEDDKFDSIWKDPTKPFQSRCVCCVEPNFSDYKDTPRAEVRYRTYQKRWIARFWQDAGIKIFVDLNVNDRFFDLNMLGVPDKWRAYFTRGYSNYPEKNIPQYELACQKAQTDDIIFIVYGGGETIHKLCQRKGWIYVQDRRVMNRQEWTKKFNAEVEQREKEVKDSGSFDKGRGS